MRSPRYVLALATASLLAVSLAAHATETENRGLRVLPKPGPVTVDGKFNDWDLSGGLFACGELEHLRDRSSVWMHAMYDADNLYLLARWKDETPLNNPEALGGHGFNGDCLQFRFVMIPNSVNEVVTWWDAWRDNQGRNVLHRASPGPKNGVREASANLPDLTETFEAGAKQGFQIDADGKGYSQELAIPWKLLSQNGLAPAPGEKFRFTIEPNFTAGAYGRITIKDIFDEQSKTPDRVFTFRAYKDWGWATIEPKGKVQPQPVRLADARTFPVSMRGGMPEVDWTGLIKRFEWPGFKTINFNMPFKGYVSLNIVNQDGAVVRHLLNQDPREAGPSTINWDGLTDATFRTPGMPVPAGNYTWQAKAMPGAALTFRGFAGYGGRVPWQATAADAWLGDHGVPSAVVTDGERMYLACNGAEGGRHLLATDFDGKVIWGLQNTVGGADPEVIAVGGGVVYVVHPTAGWIKSNAIISRVDTKTGAYQAWTGRKNHILNAEDVFGAGSTQRIKGLDVLGDSLYGTSGDSLIILDAATGNLKKTWPLAGGSAIKVKDEHTAYVVSGSDIQQVDPTTGAAKAFVTGLSNPRSVTVDTQGRVWVSIAAPAHQVVAYSPAGKELGRVGEAGGRGLGLWQPAKMYEPAGIAIDPKGKLWVMEHDFFPKRVSTWDTSKLGKPSASPLVKELFGPTHYGASGGAINPRDPNIMVSEGCEWRIDPKTGTGVCLGTFDRSLHEFATYREGSNGKLYLVTDKMRYGNGTLQVWERIGDANYALRAEMDNGAKSVDAKAGATTLWVDLNGDGQRQPEEVQQREGGLFTAGSNSWSLNLGPDMTLYAFDRSDNQLKSLAMSGFTAGGAPKYDFANLKPMPGAMSQGYQPNYSCAVPSADNKTILLNLAVPNHPAKFVWHGFDLATGQLKWTYPNPYFQVHGSHLAPAPENGLFRGAYGPVGSGTLPGVGSFWAINGNLGEWWALSSDGYFVSRIFNGNVFDWNWPTENAVGKDFMDLPAGSGGEDFGGSLTQAKDGKVYVQAGKSGVWNLELTGFDKFNGVGNGKVALSEADTAQARELREAALQASAAGGKLAVKWATVPFTGNINGDFAGGQIASFQKSEDASVKAALAYDTQYLYAAWQVKDSSPWINGAQDISQMYASGDTVDLQLGTDPKADPKRRKPAKGDLRISIGNFQGKPTAVLYRWVSDEKKPRIFTSGVVQGYQVDYVDVIADAKIVVKPGNGSYTVEAAIPLVALGITAPNKQTLRGDLGVTHADAAGVRTRLRTYWSNQETGLVDDVVFEIQPAPQNWGEFSFE